MPDMHIQPETIAPAKPPLMPKCAKGNAPAAPAEVQPFQPLALIQSVMAALAPLLDPAGSNEALKPGLTKRDVIVALKPILGHFTVADAALTAPLLMKGYDISYAGVSYGAYLAGVALIDFACIGSASSKACAAARSHMVQFGFTGDVELGDDNKALIIRTLCNDIGDLCAADHELDGMGDQFGDTDMAGVNWYDRRASWLKECREEEG